LRGLEILPCIWCGRMRKRYATVRTDSGGRALSLLPISFGFFYIRTNSSVSLGNQPARFFLTSSSARNPINSCGPRTCHGPASRRPRLCTLPRTPSSFDPSVKKAIPLSVVQTCAVGLAASASSIATRPSGSIYRVHFQGQTPILYAAHKGEVPRQSGAIVSSGNAYLSLSPPVEVSWSTLRNREISTTAQLRM
jgi:hypothetical protein